LSQPASRGNWYSLTHAYPIFLPTPSSEVGSTIYCQDAKLLTNRMTMNKLPRSKTVSYPEVNRIADRQCFEIRIHVVFRLHTVQPKQMLLHLSGVNHEPVIRISYVKTLIRNNLNATGYVNLAIGRVRVFVLICSATRIITGGLTSCIIEAIGNDKHIRIHVNQLANVITEAPHKNAGSCNSGLRQGRSACIAEAR